jgi:hypothetical protein
MHLLNWQGHLQQPVLQQLILWDMSAPGNRQHRAPLLVLVCDQRRPPAARCAVQLPMKMPVPLLQCPQLLPCPPAGRTPS